jgi:acetyl-CoA synthetase
VQVPSVLVYENDNAVPAADCPFVVGRDVWWQAAVEAQPTTCPVEWVESEHPLFLLYTSGSTGEGI